MSIILNGTEVTEVIVNGTKLTSFIVNGVELLDQLKIVDWATGSWEDISAMLDAHYQGKINIADYWNVGDTREVSLPDIGEYVSYTRGTAYVKEQPAQTVQYVIIGFNHDDLTSGGKSAVTLHQRYGLSVKDKMNEAYQSVPEARYKDSIRRGWLNSNYYNALPSGLKTLVKSVEKQSIYATNMYKGVALETTSELVWFNSATEVDGNAFEGLQDGVQYDYFKDVNNRILSSDFGNNWWLRSAIYDKSGGWDAEFADVAQDGNIYRYYSVWNNYLCPSFCL